MPSFPLYEQRSTVNSQGQASAPRPVAITTAPGEALGQLGRGVQEIADAQRLQQNENDVNAINDVYANQFSPALRTLLYDPETGLMSKQGKDAVGALPGLEKQISTLREQTVGALASERQKKAFNVMTQRHVQAELDGAYRHVSRENQVWQQQTSDAVVSDKVQSSVAHFNDPAWVNSAIASGQIEIQNYGVQHGQSAEVIQQRSTSFVRQTRTAVAQRLLVFDPLAARDYVRDHENDLAGPQFSVLEHQVHQAVMPIEARTIADGVVKSANAPKLDAATTTAARASSSFDNVMQFIFTKEGGYNSSDGNSGAPVNFGINQRANPDIDVKSLTKEGAAEIYKDRYWNAIGGDNLPPGTAIMAMDAAVNQGVGFAKRLLRESGGDVAKMAELRRQQYKDIVAKDPTLSRFKGQWLARVDEAEAQAKAQPAPEPDAPTAADMRAGLSDMIAEAEKQAQEKYPNDPVFRDMAVSQVKGYLNNIVAGQVAQQQQAHGVLVSAAMGTGRGSPKPTSLDALLSSSATRQAFSISPPESQRGIIALLDHNAREAIGSPSKDDPTVMSSLFSRIHLADEDPNKIRISSQLAPFFAKGLSREGYDWLNKELDQQQTAGGRSRTKDLELASSSAGAMLTKSMLGGAMPEKAAEAAYRFRLDLAAKVEAYEKSGKDTRPLYTPGNPEYALDPAKVMSYLQTPQQAIAQQAQAVAKGRESGGIISSAVAAPIRVKVTDAATWATVKSGDEYIDSKGNVRRKP